jgi:hypothetical protein
VAEPGEQLREQIEALVDFEERAPGSDAERRAAGHLAERLRDDEREAEIEHCDTWPHWPLALSVLAILSVLGSVVSVSEPVPGAALVLTAALLTFIDGAGITALARRPWGRRATQNVVSVEHEGKPGTLVLVAHYDAGSQGAIYGRRVEERRAALGRLIRRPIGRLEPLFWAELMVLVCCLLRLPGIESSVLTAVQFVPTVMLIVAIPLLVDLTLSPASPGAKDNASGVAVATELARRHGGTLEHFDLWVLLTGAREALTDGMRGFLRGRRRELGNESTVFVNLDEVGAGQIRYTAKEGALLATRSHPQLVEICEEIAEDADEEDTFGARPIVNRTQSDGAAVRVRGYPGITITCRNVLDYVPDHHQASDTPGRVELAALERAIGFGGELIERVDAQLGPAISESG